MKTSTKIYLSLPAMIGGTIVAAIVGPFMILGGLFKALQSPAKVLLYPFVVVGIVLTIAFSPFISIAILFGWRPAYIMNTFKRNMKPDKYSKSDEEIMTEFEEEVEEEILSETEVDPNKEV